MDTKIYLAPMSGVTDLAFRLMSREAGCAHCFFEMIDSRSIIHSHPKTLRLIKTLKNDSPISAQLVGEDPSIMLEAALKLTSLVNISFLDINSACPAKKVIKKGAGAALLNDPSRLSRIIKGIASSLKIPVTVKLRTGFNKKDVGRCVNVAKICRDSGASTIFMHGRIASQGYAGMVDYESIKAVKKALDIPVFGSGDIINPFMAKKMLDETSSDGILVARGALGNPWIFRDIRNYLDRGVIAEQPSLKEKKKALKKHLLYIEKYKDMRPSDKTGFMVKVAICYLKGISNAAETRRLLTKVKSYKELVKIIDLAR